MKSGKPRNFSRSTSAAWIAAILAAIAVGMGGCREQKKQLPSTLHPVHGKVQFKSGKPVTNGIVCFQSREDTLISATGAISAEGTFTLSSFTDGDRKPGALPGRHRVIITPPNQGPGVSGFLATTLPEPLIVKPGDNEFTLTVDGPG